MTHYNSLNVKLSNSQPNKLKPSIKNETDVVLRISSNMVGNSNDNTNFPNELLLTNRQVANIRKAFAKNTSTDIKMSKTQLSKMIQSGGFLGRLSKYKSIFAKGYTPNWSEEVFVIKKVKNTVPCY